MTTAQTSTSNACADDSIGTAEFPYLPVEIIPAEIETAKGVSKGGYTVNVFRYAVEGGWIVGTFFAGRDGFAQSFVPDPDYDWTLTFAGNKTQQTPQT